MPNTNSLFISPLALSTLDGLIGVTLNGARFDGSGSSVAGAGDVNGDGFDDVIIGAPSSSPGGLSGVGASYLIFGHTDVWTTPLALDSLNGTNGVVISGVAAGYSSGWSVASAGDVNGDGIIDMLIGAPYACPGGFTFSGSTYLIFGHTGIWDSPLMLGTLNGSNGVVINGVAPNDYSGWSVASAGDVNGDDLSDLIIGAPNPYPGNFSFTGSAYLIFGHTGTWSSTLELSSLNGTNGVAINGVTPNDFIRSSVASAGDVNGDRLSDILIGAPYASPGNVSSAGSTYLIFGHTGDWSSPLELSSLNGTNGVIINGIAGGDNIGNSVAGAGDLNGDGINDLMIGAPNASPGGFSGAGSTYLIFGHTGAWSSPLSLGSLNGTNGVAINSITRNEYSGSSIAAVRDINGDGLSDVLIGAYQASPGGLSFAGSTYLIFGHRNAWSSPLILGSLNLNGKKGLVINGIEGGSGYSVAGAGDVNRDGLSDLIIGAYQASPGGLGSAGSTYLIFGDSLDLLSNTLTISQGETIILNNSMLAAYHPNNLAMNASIPFKITNVVHGTFSTLNFLQSELSQQLVSFTHDGSIYAPSYEVTVGNWAIIGPQAAIIIFDVPPVIYVNPFSVGQGQTAVLNNRTIRATMLYYPAEALMFTVSNVLHGNFVKINTTIIENQFNQSMLADGQISFATDGSANAPSYDISVGNGRVKTSVVHGTVYFNAAPIMLNNQLTLAPGQKTIILSSNELSASDGAISLEELIFAPSTLNCHFENLNLPGIALSLFLQKNIQNNQIVFFWDEFSNPPFYNMSVSDGTLSTSRPATIIITPISDISNSNAESTNSAVIIGSLVATISVIGLLWFGFQWYAKKKTNEQLQRMLLAGISDTEKSFNIDVVCPIVNKIFSLINTMGFFGQRSEADTKAYMMAIGKIVSELRRQNANLDFNAMEPVDKESFLNEIANQTRQQSLPQHKGYSCGRCTRYFKAEATPQEIEYAAEGIALASAAWQRRHMGGVSAKNTSLGFELGKLSDIGFSDEAASEGVPPEKQFKLMQNHMKAMEQREQKQQQELKQLEERLAQQEAELASFKRQSVIRSAS